MKRFSSVSKSEVSKFSALSSKWWDKKGEFKLLHQMNPIRLRYIRNHVGMTTRGETPLRGKRVLDVGCGGGILSEPLARLGAHVTGIDASLESIRVASKHAELNELKIDYQHITAENLKSKFDVVCALEIIEHVENQKEFIKSLVDLLNVNGMLFISTINKTLLSKFLTIYMAEYVLQLVPKNTHDYSKYISPQTIKSYAEEAGKNVMDVQGLRYLKNWQFCNSTQVNYIMLIK